jgi:peptide deformylase
MSDSASSPAYPTSPALVYYPAPVLRVRAAPVSVFDDALAGFCQRMFAVMADAKGIGLAAPQVGVSRRIFITDHARKKDGQPPDPRVWINPVIEGASGTTVYEEGCLSFPDIYARVKRHDRFTIRWQDLTGAAHSLALDVTAGDFLGIVVQHETDHLDGVVFVDHLTQLQLGLCRRRLRDLEADYREATGRTGTVLRR